MHAPDPPLPPLVTRAQARAAGMTDRQITRRLHRREWTAARRGLLVVPGRGRGDPEPLDVQVVAAVRSTGREVVVSGAHAARIWGLPKPLPGWGRPVLLAATGPTRTTRELRIRVAPCADGDVLRLPGGLLVTSPRRTVVDCLRTLAPPDALAVADAALRAGLVAPAELRAAVDVVAGWPGVRQARHLAALADARRETALESWSGLAFDRFDVPQPQWQTDVHDADGFIGRADGWWRPGVARCGPDQFTGRAQLAALRLAPSTASSLLLASERYAPRV